MAEVYPKILTREEIENQIKGDGDRARASYIEKDIKGLKEKLVHYEKKEKKYASLNDKCRLAHTISGTLAFSAGTLLIFPIVNTVAITLAISSGLLSTILEIISRSYLRRRKIYFATKVEEIKELINKANYLYKKALRDGVITVEELDEYKKVIDESLVKIKNDDQIEKKESDDFLETIKNTALDLAKKEFTEEKIQELKLSYHQNLNSKYSVPASITTK